MDLSVLDVLQIFGRAGRPGMETSGEGYICTTNDKLDHYLDVVVAQVGFLPSVAHRFSEAVPFSMRLNPSKACRFKCYESVRLMTP
jgi:hypothetical protein